MRGGQAATSLAEHVDDLAPVRVRRHPAGHRRADHELHREVDLVAVSPGVVDRDDVGVIEQREGARLADQPVLCDPLIAHRVEPEQLDGDPSRQNRVECFEHQAHRADPDRLPQLEPADRLASDVARPVGGWLSGRAGSCEPRDHEPALVAAIEVGVPSLALVGFPPSGRTRDGFVLVETLWSAAARATDVAPGTHLATMVHDESTAGHEDRMPFRCGA